MSPRSYGPSIFCMWSEYVPLVWEGCEEEDECGRLATHVFKTDEFGLFSLCEAHVIQGTNDFPDARVQELR